MRDPYNNDFTVLEKEAKEDPECLIHLAAQQEVKEEASKAIFDMLVGVSSVCVCVCMYVCVCTCRSCASSNAPLS